MKRPRRATGLTILLLLLIVAIAAGLRFYNLGSQSLWADEGNSAALATRSLAQISRDAANDIHPPLYYWLLHLWTRVFGTSETGLRALSAVLGVLLVVVVSRLGRHAANSATGLAAAFVAALSPFQIYYSQETRMYMLLALEAAVSMLLFCWFVGQEDHRLPRAGGPPPRRLRWLPFSGQLLVLTWAAGLYTHYAFPLIIGLASLLYVIWLMSTRRRGLAGWRLLRWALLLLLTAGFFAPWLSTAIRQLTTWPAGETTAGFGVQLRGVLTTLGLGPVALGQSGAWWTWILPALALIGTLPWPHGDRAGQVASSRLDWLRWLTPLTWLIAVPAMILFLGLYREAYLKFLLIASPALALLIGRAVIGPVSWLTAQRSQSPEQTAQQAALAALGELTPDVAEEGRPPVRASLLAGPLEPRVQRETGWRDIVGASWIVVVIAVIGAVSGAALARYYGDATVARDDYRGIAKFIVATEQPTDAILLTAPGQSEVFNYYYRNDTPVYPLPRQRPLDPVATLTELNGFLDFTKIYAVYWAAEQADPQGLIRHWMDTRGYKTLDQWRGNVRLTVYVMPERRAPDEVVDNLNLPLGPAITLLGYRGWNLAPTAGEVTQIQLQWRAERVPERRYKVFLQLLDPRDQVIAQRDAEPAGESRPTTQWAAGEVVLDNHGLLIPPGTPPGSYRRIIGMYDTQTGERLRLPDGSDFISLPPITVARAKNAPPLAAFAIEHTQSFDFGGITLLGHDRYKRGFGHAPETPLAQGDLLHLTFYWQANIAPRADWWFDLTLSDASGRTVASLQAPLVSESYSTPLWQEGEVVRGEHDLGLPPDLPPDTYRLSLILLPDAQTPAGTAYLGTVKVQASTQGD